MRKSIIALGGAALLLLGVLVPATAAATSESFGWSDAYTTDHACNIVEHVEVSVQGRAYFDGDGDWMRDILRFRYSVTYENTGTGEQLVTRTVQNVEVTPENVTLRAQGYFIRGGAVNGVVFPDVGRLVLDPTDGSTLFASAKVVRADDPEAWAALDPALCEALD